MAKAAKANSKPRLGGRSPRRYALQADVPAYSLDEALRVPKVIHDEYAGDATSPLRVAKALGLTPSSSHFRMLCGAAVAYGLTDGGPKAAHIRPTPLGTRIVAPEHESDEFAARREAFLKPRVVGKFVRKYDGSPLPRPETALDVLEEMGLPAHRGADARHLIEEGARSLGLLQEIKGKWYVDTGEAAGPGEDGPSADDITGAEDEDSAVAPAVKESVVEEGAVAPGREAPEAMRRVFITHGKNKAFIGPIKKLLRYGELEPVVSVERQSASKPVPDKVTDDMRSCGAAIIHVDAEETVLDADGNERTVINPNVLIEIGAAMALYGRRFILLVREGVQLPSNLQGLYEVRYSGDALDGDATLRLLEATNDMKSYRLPHRYGASTGEGSQEDPR